ncbi:nitronate monooxygenase [Lactobacillus sp. ESL0791]|uniref:NAD(P)H-dependent flavin oxidoreductase n=1 Tax=Lactobacillus sp. ESL0791 TaxID=2983234 RepID=UPI0023F7084B|nr:nitronate monooxygenase [Lactobacillus sp. ESL0791]MDF7639704.1 nitronate monooxygenase [Lactobacillus sp. ESL0791]
MTQNRVSEILNIKYPIISAAMWGLTNAKMVAAVSDAGGLGVLGPMPGQKPSNGLDEAGEVMREQIREVKTLTDKPFAVNIIADDSGANSGISSDLFAVYLDVMIEEKVPVALVVGHLSNHEFFDKLQKNNIKIIYRPNEADPKLIKQAEEMGLDAIIATGLDEGGGLPINPWLAGTFSVVPRFVDEATIPVIAAGGITDGRTAKAAVDLGAEGLYIGTRFLVTNESPLAENVKDLIVKSKLEDLVYLPDPTSETIRAIKTPKLPEIIKRISSGQISGTSTLLNGMLKGDLDNGTVVTDTGLSLIHSVKSVKEVIDELKVAFE